MKLTLSTLACPAWTMEQIVQSAHANGIHGIDFRGIGPDIDITLLPPFTSGLADTLKLLNEHQLQMPCLNSSITLVTPDAQKWDLMLDEARRSAVLAQRTRTRYLRIFGGSIPKEMSNAQAESLAKSHLRQIISITLPTGTKPLLETHDAWVRSESVLSLIHEFQAQEVGVLWDLEHPWRGNEAPFTTASVLGSRIEHVHIKDTIRVGGSSRPVLLGLGQLPLEDSLAALRHINYAGWISLETEKRWHADGPEPEESVPQFAAYMRTHSW